MLLFLSNHIIVHVEWILAENMSGTNTSERRGIIGYKVMVIKSVKWMGTSKNERRLRNALFVYKSPVTLTRTKRIRELKRIKQKYNRAAHPTVSYCSWWFEAMYVWKKVGKGLTKLRLDKDETFSVVRYEYESEIRSRNHIWCSHSAFA